MKALFFSTVALLAFSMWTGNGIPEELTIEGIEPDQLAKLLESDDLQVRRKALMGVAGSNFVPEKFQSVLWQAMKDEDRSVRQMAAVALVTSGLAEQPILDELIHGMAAPSKPHYGINPDDPLAAMLALQELKEKAVPALIAALEDEQYAGWHLAVSALGHIGPAAKPALPALTKAIQNQQRNDLAPILEAKWHIDGDGAYARKELIPLLDTKEGRMCNGAVRVLVLMGADAKEAIPALIRAVKKYREDEDAYNLAWALGELAAYDKEQTMPVLFEVLSEYRMANEASQALVRLAVPAEEIVPHLVRALDRNKDHSTAPHSFARALEPFGSQGKAAIPSLIYVLKHPNTAVRGRAAESLGKMGPDAQDAIPALTEAVDDPYATTQAVRALEWIRGVDPQAK